MIFVLFGPPGSGKGTQAQIICQEFDFHYIATGNLLRAEVAKDTPLGQKINQFIGSGKFPPDELIIDVFQKSFDDNHGKHVLLDGMPRTLNQAKLMDGMLDARKTPVTQVIDFHVNQEDLLVRILGRITCMGCGATFHKTFNPPEKEGVCDFCGSTNLTTRSDDQESILKKRMELYYLETLPILEYYSSKDIVTSIDASMPLEHVTDAIMTIFKKIL